jgi:hypothetical protein
LARFSFKVLFNEHHHAQMRPVITCWSVTFYSSFFQFSFMPDPKAITPHPQPSNPITLLDCLQSLTTAWQQIAITEDWHQIIDLDARMHSLLSIAQVSTIVQNADSAMQLRIFEAIQQLRTAHHQVLETVTQHGTDVAEALRLFRRERHAAETYLKIRRQSL